MFTKKTKFSMILPVAVILLSAFTNFGERTLTNEEMATKIFNKLLAVITNVPPDVPWPPKFVYDGANREINAYAGYDNDGVPTVWITAGIMDKIAQGNEEIVAYIIGHEMGHHLGKHVGKADPDAVQRQEELEADKLGMEIVLKAGYSYRAVEEAMKAMKYKSGDYSTFESVASSHPSWTERLAALDLEKAFLWRSLAAFETGIYFLFYENFEAAEACFHNVLKEFPDCYEAYANLGYAQLMRYLDQLEDQDLKYFNVNQIIIGSFYKKPVSIENQVRGIDEDLWFKAIDNFKAALRINPNLSLVKSNLGIAYMFDPRKKSLGDAERAFAESLDEMSKDPNIDPYITSIVYVNAGAVDVALNKSELALQKVNQAEQIFKDASAKYTSASEIYSGFSMPSMSNTVNYNLKSILNTIALNKILLEYKTKTTDAAYMKDAVAQLERYLMNNHKESIWWKLAYERYQDVCKSAGAIPKSVTQLDSKSKVNVKPVQSITIGDKILYIAITTKEASEILGDVVVVPVIKEKKIANVIARAKGIEMLSDGKILAIVLTEGYKDAIEFDGLKNIKYTLRVGMSREEAVKILDDDNDLTYQMMSIPGRNSRFRFYRELGIGVSFDKGKVTEIIITT